MKIQIDSTIVASDLALDDVVANFNVTKKQAINLIDKETEISNLISMQNYYRNKYDYYFEILTNHAL